MRDEQIKDGVPSVNDGRGGSNTQYDHKNILGEAEIMVQTTRTGVGLGEGFTGAVELYSN